MGTLVSFSNHSPSSSADSKNASSRSSPPPPPQYLHRLILQWMQKIRYLYYRTCHAFTQHDETGLAKLYFQVKHVRRKWRSVVISAVLFVWSLTKPEEGDEEYIQNLDSKTFSFFIYEIIRYANLYRVYQNDWSGFEFDYIHKYGGYNQLQNRSNHFDAPCIMTESNIILLCLYWFQFAASLPCHSFLVVYVAI